MFGGFFLNMVVSSVLSMCLLWKNEQNLFEAGELRYESCSGEMDLQFDFEFVEKRVLPMQSKSSRLVYFPNTFLKTKFIFFWRFSTSVDVCERSTVYMYWWKMMNRFPHVTVYMYWCKMMNRFTHVTSLFQKIIRLKVHLDFTKPGEQYRYRSIFFFFFLFSFFSSSFSSTLWFLDFALRIDWASFSWSVSTILAYGVIL